MTGGRLYHHSAWAGWTLAPGAQNSMAWPGQDIANIDGKWVLVCRPCTVWSAISGRIYLIVCRSQLNISHSPAASSSNVRVELSNCNFNIFNGQRPPHPATPGFLLWDVFHCQSMDWERVNRISVTKISQPFKLVTA